MARKKLLSEGEIRQFMKLANLRPIGQERLSEMGGGYGSAKMSGARDEEDDMMGDAPPMEMDAEVDVDADEMDDTEDMDDAMDDMDDGALEMEPAGEEDPKELVMTATDALEKLANMAGVDMEVQDESEEMETAEVPPMMEADDETETAAFNTDDIVAEVTKRVAARLQSEQQAAERKEQIADQLAERIMKRLTNK
jgi:hypothetical protein